MSNEIQPTVAPISNGPATSAPVSSDIISLRAYQLWEARGCPVTDGAEDWEAAETQLLGETQPSETQQLKRRQPLRKLFARMRRRAA